MGFQKKKKIPSTCIYMKLDFKHMQTYISILSLIYHQVLYNMTLILVINCFCFLNLYKMAKQKPCIALIQVYNKIKLWIDKFFYQLDGRNKMYY